MVFFLGFVFFIVIVLMNLLNALAVADAKEMLEDAAVLKQAVVIWKAATHIRYVASRRTYV